jgi:hypothetical protein
MLHIVRVLIPFGYYWLVGFLKHSARYETWIPAKDMRGSSLRYEG